MPQMVINGRAIGAAHKPFIIAEMSANHNQSFDNAVEIISAAAEAGADAIKIQTYTPDTLTLNCNSSDFKINNPESLWDGSSLYELYSKAYMDWNWIGDLSEVCKKKNITFFSSVFDETSVDFMEQLNTPAYKIASFENNHYPLIKKVISTGKPMIVSTGVTSESDIDDLVAFISNEGFEEFALLKCTSDYPAKVEASNLANIPRMRKKYQCEIGLSDHTLGIGTALAAVALGASIVEKHFTTSKEIDSVDVAFSSDTAEMKLLVSESENAWKSLGRDAIILSEREKNNLQFKRSIYASQDIAKGDNFTRDNIKVVRPGFGMHPKHFDDIINTPASKEYKFGDPIKEMLL